MSGQFADRFVEIDYAKTDRSMCRGCKLTIARGEIRLAESFVDHQMQSHPWRHLDCMRLGKGYLELDPDEIRGILEIGVKDRIMVKERIRMIQENKGKQLDLKVLVGNDAREVEKEKGMKKEKGIEKEKEKGRKSKQESSLEEVRKRPYKVKPKLQKKSKSRTKSQRKSASKPIQSNRNERRETSREEPKERGAANRPSTNLHTMVTRSMLPRSTPTYKSVEKSREKPKENLKKNLKKDLKKNQKEKLQQKSKLRIQAKPKPKHSARKLKNSQIDDKYESDESYSDSSDSRSPVKTANKKRGGATKKNDTKITRSQEQKYQKLQSEWMLKTNDQLKQILSKNGLSKTGNKSDLAERCAVGQLFGKVSRCPHCGGGRPRLNIHTLVYKCSGYMDDDHYRNCHKTFQLDELPKQKWIS